MQVAPINAPTESFESSPNFSGYDISPEQIDTAIRLAQPALLKRQNPIGYWAGELQADTSVPAGYMALMVFMRGAVEAGAGGQDRPKRAIPAESRWLVEQPLRWSGRPECQHADLFRSKTGGGIQPGTFHAARA